MPNGKRASMREGPLAALFRKTAQDTEEHTVESSPASPIQVPATDPAPSAYEPDVPARRPPEPEPEVEEPRLPLPHERLRHAFSADIPENMLERREIPEPAMSEPASQSPSGENETA